MTSAAVRPAAGSAKARPMNTEATVRLAPISGQGIMPRMTVLMTM